MKKVVLSFIVLSMAAMAKSNVSWELVEAIRQVETGGRNVAGDNGLARGQWQMWAGAWKDVNKLRASQKLLTYSYQFAWNERVSRVYAHDYLQILRTRFVISQRREPDVIDLWAMWNIGHKGYVVDRKADITKCNKSTFVNSVAIQNLVKKYKEDSHAVDKYHKR